MNWRKRSTWFLAAIVMIGAVAIMVSVPSPAVATDFNALFGGEGGDNDPKLLGADELALMLTRGDPNLYVYDANQDSFRHENGIIPGARLLSSPVKYNVATSYPSRTKRNWSSTAQIPRAWPRMGLPAAPPMPVMQT
jgi:hypothetical protein